MSQHFEKPVRECSKCTGYTFPGGCANYCELFEIDDDYLDLDPPETRGETVCDNCLSAITGHCPGQLDCDKWRGWIGTSRSPIDEKDMEPRTIGFHLLDSDSN